MKLTLSSRSALPGEWLRSSAVSARRDEESQIVGRGSTAQSDVPPAMPTTGLCTRSVGPSNGPSCGRVRGRIMKANARMRLAVATSVLVAASLTALRMTSRSNPVVWRAQPVAALPYPYPFVASPNADARPPGEPINCVVLHATVEPTLEGTERIFLDPAKRRSAHFVVGKEGQVVQMVPVDRRAWHAGKSVLDGVQHVNDYSVGIELVNRNDGTDPYPEAQIQAAAGILRFLRSRYDIPDDRVVSHAQIALPPGRKTDPAGLDFGQVLAAARVPAEATPGTPAVAVSPGAEAAQPTSQASPPMPGPGVPPPVR